LAWTTPKTWSTNETLTSANMNTHLRDNENWLANDKPRCRIAQSAVQNITTGTLTGIQFDGADIFDVGAMHNPASNNTRITIPSGGGGTYLIGVDMASWQDNNTGIRDLIIRVNGATTVNWQRLTTNQNTNTYQSLSILLPLVATDYVEAMVNQNSGATLTMSGTTAWAIWQAF